MVVDRIERDLPRSYRFQNGSAKEALIGRALFFVFILVFSLQSFSQMNARSIRKNNKQMARFQGKKNIFHGYSGYGFFTSALNYFGDLAPLPSKFSTDISFTKPAVGFSLFHRFGPRYTLAFDFMYGTLKGSDSESARGVDGPWRRERNLSFRNRIKEFSVTATFDLFKNEATYISRVRWTPYAFFGLGLLFHNPQAIAPDKFLDGSPNPLAGQWVNLQPLGTEGQYSNLTQGDINSGIKPYSLTQIVIPFGVGARIRLNEVIDLSADIAFRYTFTDYLDDVSKNYVDLGVFTQSGSGLDNKLAQALSYRSNEIGNADPEKFTSASYVSRYDGKSYDVVNGFGSEFRDNWRGHASAKDIYMVTSVKITRIIGNTFHRAKFR